MPDGGLRLRGIIISLLDAYKVAIAIETNCETFLTNDIALKRVTELPVLVVDELEL